MGLVKCNAVNNASRNFVKVDFKKIFTSSKNHPEKSLIKKLKQKSGRNNQGVITVRHRHSGHKQFYRLIDFKRSTIGITGTIKTIEYDPYRNAAISLIVYQNGKKSYIITPEKSKIGDKIICDDNVGIKTGNCTSLKNIAPGLFVHNVELYPGHGGQIARGAGVGAKILGFDETNNFVILKLPSGEYRKINKECKATIGNVSLAEHQHVKLAKAGRRVWMGWRPTVRGSAMNPVDHPHGGGEGKSPVGRKSPLTPWGKKALGVKTRRSNKYSNKLITRTRHSGKK